MAPAHAEIIPKYFGLSWGLIRRPNQAQRGREHFPKVQGCASAIRSPRTQAFIVAGCHKVKTSKRGGSSDRTMQAFIRCLRQPHVVLYFPVDASLPCFFPRSGRVSTLFFIDSGKNLIWNARKAVGSIVDAERAIV